MRKRSLLSKVAFSSAAVIFYNSSVTYSFSFFDVKSFHKHSHACPSSKISTLKTTTQLDAKRGGRGGDSGNGSAKKKGKLSNKKSSKKNLNEQKKQSSSTRISASKKKVTLPSKTKKSPPWQVKSKSKNGSKGSSSSSGINLSLLSDSDRELLSWKPFVPDRDVGGVAYVGSYLGAGRMPPRIGVPEVAFLGRSNVGKSSLLNALLSVVSKAMDADNSYDQARVGKTPGATAAVNLYALLQKYSAQTKQKARAATSSNKKSGLPPPKPIMGFVDLPGFGYAKLSKENKQDVEDAAERYLEKRKELSLGVLLVDIRREPSDDDRAVLAALYDLNIPLLIVATKVDKLAKNDIESSLEVVQRGLGLPPGQPLCVSSVTGEGISTIWRILMESCETRVFEINENMRKFGEYDRPDDFDTIKLDDKGEFPDDDDDVQYSMGYDWIQSLNNEEIFDDDDEHSDFNESAFISDESRQKMIENEDRQREATNAMKLKSLNERVRKMQRRGEI